MGRPRSNLKPQLEWSKNSGAFEPPEFSMLDAKDFPANSKHVQLNASRPIQPTTAVQSVEQDPPSLSNRSTTSHNDAHFTHEAGAPSTPPSLNADSDSDLDALEVMVVLPSEGEKTPPHNVFQGKSSAEEMNLLSSSPMGSPARLPERPLNQYVSRSPVEKHHNSSRVTTSGNSVVMTSSPPPPPPPPPPSSSAAKQDLAFRMGGISATEMPSQLPEIGSLLSEKIAIQEQKIDFLYKALAANQITVDTYRLDERLREVDRRIDRFAQEDFEPPAVPGFSPGKSSQTSSNQGIFPEQGLDGYNTESDDDLDVLGTRSGGLVDLADPLDHGAVHTTTEGGSRYVDLVGTSSDFEDSPYFNNMNNYSTAAQENYQQVDDYGDDPAPMSSDTMDIIMETAPQPVPTQSSSHSQAQSKPWTKEVMYILRTKFGLPGFRPNQLEAVNETLAGNDLVVLMPTGGGKSLCYQLPALCTTGATCGTTIVISPLISLMQDQVYHLKNRNIRAEMINSKLNASERNEAFSRLSAGDLQLVYISPEMLSVSSAMRSVLQKLHTQNKLARIVIDEAHCVSSWGHDFRPDYKELDRVKNEYPGTPILALTATANERVLLDIVGCLRPNPIVLRQSFNRRNLIYEVRPKPSQVVNEIAAICRQFTGKTGIVYCFSKRSCEETAADLRSMGISAAHYHAGMDQESRAQTQQDWQDGRCTVVCATIAFGMGIDKPNVRFVVHQTLPRNIEGYYQETGRAGRDGRISTCVLFYNYGDVQLVRRMIDSDTNLTYVDKEHHRALLNRMLQYCENKTDCRRKQVLQYFNEEFDAKHCAFMCDNCQNMKGQVVLNKDLTAEAKLLLQMAQSVQHRQVTIQQCLDVLLGRSTKKIKDCGFDQLPTYGKLRTMGMTEIERLAHHLVTEHGLEEYSVRAHSRYPQTYVRLGYNARNVLEGRQAVKLKTVSGPVPSAGPVSARKSAEDTGSKRAARSTTTSFRSKRGRYSTARADASATSAASGMGSRSYEGRRAYGKRTNSRTYGRAGADSRINRTL